MDLDLIGEGISYLRSIGYNVRDPLSEYSPRGYLAGSDASRAEEFNALLHDEDIDVILCARGGYGSLRILKHIDYVRAGSAPKLLVGYSDITALQLALLAKSGIPSVSGPMLAIEWSDENRRNDDSLWRLLKGACPDPLLGTEGQNLSPLRPGTVTGRLIGGNLSVLCKLIGSGYLPDMTGAILFLEDVAELPYQIDGLFAQLMLSGILGRIGGLVIGEFSPPAQIPEKPSLTYMDVRERDSSEINGPVATNLQYGHIDQKIAIPIGVQARLSVDSDATLSILESVVDMSKNHSSGVV